MGSNGKDEVMISKIETAECSDATVEIKIKTLDSETYTLRVDKCVPVPALKDQIATVTGVLSEQQRLICRGKVLRDDQLLSAYHVEDGHTLHLVVRQPIPSASESLPDNPATDPALSPGHSSSVLVGTFNISEQGDGVFPDLNRLVSAVLSSFGMSSPGSGSDGVDLRESAVSWLPRTPGLSGLREPGSQHTDQDVTTGQSNPLIGASPSLPTAAASLDPLQPLVIPDSLTTLSQYLSRLRNEFGADIGDNNNSHATGTQANSVQESVAASRAAAGQGGLPTPANLAEVMLSTRQILVEQAAECLLQLTSQLENHSNVTDALARAGVQSNAIRSGVLLQNLGALLLELGRTTMTLRMGQTQADAIVNAGPAVFISTSGPNPIMVQPLPFHPGASFGAIPMGTLQAGSGSPGGSLGSTFTPRNIDIRIRTGSLMPTGIANHMESTGMPESPEQVNTANADGGYSVHQAASGASMVPSSAREAEVRVVPLRTVVAAVPAHVRHLPSDSSRSSVGLLYPVLARVQRVTSGNSNGARGSQTPDERHPSESDLEQQPIPGSALNSTYTGRDGNGHSSGRVQDNQGVSTLHTRLDQFLRIMFPSEEIQFGGDANSQGPATNSATHNEETAQAAATTQEAALRVVDDGTLFSNLLRQVMPYISEHTGMGSNVAPSERAEVLENRHTQTSSTQENSNVGTSSSRRDDPPSPNSKRQKRE